jgi:hypothetical protein
MLQLNKSLKMVLTACLCVLSVTVMAAPLNGIYTVGGASPNYSTVVAAVSALNSNGVSGPVTFLIRNGTYTGKIQVNSISGINASRRVTFVSESNDAANVIIQNTATSSATNYVLRLNNASYITFRAVTLKNNGSSYGRVVEMKTTPSYDSIVNCVLQGPVRTSNSTNTAILYATDIKGSYNVIAGNAIKNGSYGIVYEGTSTSNLAQNATIVGNTIENTYGYASYFYYTKHLKFIDNTITTNSNYTSFYGLRSYYGDGAFHLTGNKINGFRGGYGFYLYYSDGTSADRGLIANNVIVAGNGTSSTAYGIRSNYSSYQRFYNNTVNVRSTSSGGYAGYFYYSSTTYSNNEIYNNVFANTGGGRAMYIYNPNYIAAQDYNNLYATGTVLVQRGTPSATFNNLTSWRNAVTHDHNSISYNPAFTSNTNLAPNAANAASWSLNGRGIQLAVMNTDVNGNTRPVTIAAGVPDIGAFEFAPTVTPPIANATPANPIAGTTQLFTFGEDTVATIKWDATATVPSSIAVRQYTNTAPPGINSISPTQMYFYTDFATPTGTYAHTTNLYYKDPWKGTTVNEEGLRLAQKLGSNAWTGYTPAVSTADIDRNFISTTGLTNFGYYTGIDVANNASAVAITEPKTYFCSGSYDVKVKIANKGNNTLNSVEIGWEIDGVAQTPISYNTPIPVKSNVILTLGNLSFNNHPKEIVVYTYLPNNVADPLPDDDTVKDRLSGGLVGEYTVGGTTPDYLTVKDAVRDLNDFGVCGPVVFTIRNGTYTDQLKINSVQGGSATNRVTFQSETHVAGNVIINYNLANAADNYVLQLNSASNITFKDLTIKTTNASYGRVVDLAGSAGSDSIINCTLSSSTVSSSNSNICVIYAYHLTGKDNVFMGNTILNGSYGIYYYGTSTSTLVQDAVFINNTIQNYYIYGTYFYYNKNLTFDGNTISTNSSYTSPYGIRLYYCDGGSEIVNNKIIGLKGGYGIYQYYNDATSSDKSLIANNVISMGQGSLSARGIMSYYSSYQRFYNNSVNITSTSTSGYGGYFYYTSTSYQNNEVYNNVFANTGGGYAMYVYSSTYNNESDYNNLYATGTNIVQQGSPSATYSTLSSWRVASDLDMNSISYDPGFKGPLDLEPDATNAASWSLNGRGIQIAGNDKDINGYARVTLRADGVPDIGAYEFTPGTTPPLATATPTASVAGTTQVFTFGEDTVAVIAWKPNSVVPNNIQVRQYTDKKPSQFPVPPYMYFYTDINVQNVTHEFDAMVYYKDPWLGTTGTEGNLRLAQKLGSSPWIAYNDNASAVDIVNNKIIANDMTSLGTFTGIENGNIFSAIITPLGSVVFCPNGDVVLQANSGTGYTYQWQLNGIDIPGATSSLYTAAVAGDYNVKVTNASNVTATSLSVAVTIVAPPAAVVNASGPLNYCIGGNLTLDANTGNGLTYEWFLDGLPLPGGTNATIPVSSAGNYTVVVTNIGCSTTSPATVVAPGPLTVDLGLDTSFCEQGVLTLDAGYPGASYVWNTGATSQQISVTNQSGKYWVYVDAGPNCQSSDTINVLISPLPSVAGISYLKSGLNSYMFSPSGASNVNSYLWMFSDGTKDTAKNPSHTFASNHPEVTLVLFNDCGTDTISLVLPSSVSDNRLLSSSAKIYPNPANDLVTIEIDADKNIQNITIVDNVGRIVYRESISDLVHKKQINVSALPTGYYIVRVFADDTIINIPLNVSR